MSRGATIPGAARAATAPLSEARAEVAVALGRPTTTDDAGVAPCAAAPKRAPRLVLDEGALVPGVRAISAPALDFPRAPEAE